jgi:hypothetical protein
VGFNSDKKRILSDLESLTFDHETRTGRAKDENLLAAGLISAERAIEIVMCTKGQQHENRSHHQVADLQIWVLKPVHEGVVWYVKGYFAGEQTWFISFHPSKQELS